MVRPRVGKTRRLWNQSIRLAGGGISQSKIKLLFKELGIPIGDIDSVEKGHPFPVSGHAESLLHERRPLRLQWFTHERHTGLMWGPTAFPAITFMARADHVLPNGCAALRTRNYVVEIELMTRQASAAVLADAFVARVNVVPAKAHLALGYTIVADQQNYPRNADHPIHQPHGFVVCRDRQIAPTVEIEGLVLLVDRLCDALIEKHEGAANRGNVDRQIGTVENQDLGVQYAIHGRDGRISHRLLSVLDMGRHEPGVVLSK